MSYVCTCMQGEALGCIAAQLSRDMHGYWRSQSVVSMNASMRKQLCRPLRWLRELRQRAVRHTQWRGAMETWECHSCLKVLTQMDVDACTFVQVASRTILRLVSGAGWKGLPGLIMILSCGRKGVRCR